MSQSKEGLSLGRNVKIGFFHLGSGMADVLTTGVWNRIMISDLGVGATPISLLVSLRYFLAPLGLWAGRLSDRQTIFGFRRLFWVWFGRLLMGLSTFGLGFGTVQVMRHLGQATLGDWAIIVTSMILFSLGSALSGSTFLSLIYDRTTPDQRGRAVGIVWTFLLLGFTTGGVVFSLMLPDAEGANGLSFTTGDVWRMFAIAGSLFLGLWFFSLLGEERRSNDDDHSTADTEEARSLRDDLAAVWRNPAMRFFFFYLSLSMFFAFSQDPVLEPFAADVFDMPAADTNRFAAYWGGASILASLFSLWMLRRQNWTHVRLSQVGVSLLTLTFLGLTVAAFAQIQALITPGLVLLGIGLGFWNIGTLGLMMDMSPVGRAGTFLGFWSMLVTLSRGGGITTGGVVRDLGLTFSGQYTLAYGLVFGGALIGLLVAWYCLNNITVSTVPADASDSERTATILAGSMD